MKRLATLLLGGAMAVSASALTMNDLIGHYAMENPQGWNNYVTMDGDFYYGTHEGIDTTGSEAYFKDIVVTPDGDNLYIQNFMGLSFYAEVDLENMTATVPVQYVQGGTDYVWTLCAGDWSVYDEGFDAEAFEPQDFVMTIKEDGTLSMNGAYLMFYGWGQCYGYVTGDFTHMSPFVSDVATAEIAGTYVCNDFSGMWMYLWATTEDYEWHAFNVATGEGIDLIYGVEAGPYNVTVAATDGNNLVISGLWWGDMSINGTYDAEAGVITFPLQKVWSGYTFCNDSFWDSEVPTEADVVPATATVNEDGSISFGYTVVYGTTGYLWGIEQKIVSENGGLQTLGVDTSDNAPVEYYNLQGVRVSPVEGGLYIMRQGSKATKVVR